MEKVTLAQVRMYRDLITKAIKDPQFAEYKEQLNAFIRSTDSVDELYYTCLIEIFNKFCEKDNDGKPIIENSFFVVKPENQNELMEKVLEINNLACDTPELEKAVEGLNVIQMPIEKINYMLNTYGLDN